MEGDIMLKEFRVKNFRGFNDEFVFKLDSVRDYEFNKDLIKNNLVNKAVIFGENSSGKSNLGYAIMDISDHLFDGIKFPRFANYLNNDSTEQYATFTYIFQFGEKTIWYLYKKDKNSRVLYEEIKENDIMGIGDKGILAVGQDIAETTKELLRTLIDEDSAIVSIYYGADVTEDDANSIAEDIAAEYPDIDVEVNLGGQPIYYYVISVE